MLDYKIGKIGVSLGIILFLVTLYSPLDLDYPAKLVLATTILMVALWVTEALPIYVTALLPLLIFPFTDSELSDTLTGYADRIIFLFLGGFMLALAIEKSMLHKRFALHILRIVGADQKHLIGSFMIATASLSAWISNTATTMLMLPIALSIISQVSNRRFATCLLLSIAYSASLGGLATLIGTPPNAILASLAKQLLDIEISFGKWLLVGVPVSIISLMVTWSYLVNIGVKVDAKPLFDKSIILTELNRLGSISRDEKIVAVVFGATAIAWITRGLLWKSYAPFIDDATIALFAALVLFLIPSRGGRLLEWNDAKKIPWGVLLLIGGGLSLASAFTATGLDLWLADRLMLTDMHHVMIIMLVVAITIFTGEIMSNTASAALLIPIGATIAGNLGIDPLLLMVPIAVATSYGFMMPVGTPPNAIIFASGYISIKDMVKVGLPLDLIGIIVVTTSSILLVPIVLG